MAASKHSPIAARPPRPRIPDFRAAIDRAVADGLDRDAMVLRLTLRDESDLKRSTGVALDEISYEGGAMRFLGVRVVAGGVIDSALDTSGLEPEPVALPKTKARSVRKA